MYERSAIVLERYFENLLDYREKCNIRDNFANYCKLVEKLDKIDKKLVNNLINAQQETAKIVCEDVKRLAPKDTGRYAESIKTSKTERIGNKIKTEIYTDATVSTVKGREYNLGYLLETGTSPHLIEPVMASVLHFKINGEDIFAKRVHHPGTIAQPHFRLGLQMNRLVYKQKINEAIRRSFSE